MLGSKREELLQKIAQLVKNEVNVSLALELFHWQYEHNHVYQDWVKSLKIQPDQVASIEQIPFLPISFFKTHTVKTLDFQPETIFKSSGTTQTQNSQHFIRDLGWYFNISKSIFEEEIGNLNDVVLLALLPNYIEQGNSSLIAMLEHFMPSAHPESGFYLYDFEALKYKLQTNIHRKTILWGVAYSLLDFAEQFDVVHPNLTVFETGGMKGRRKELLKEELQAILKEKYHVNTIFSEYGMTELLSQAYSKGAGVFEESKTLKVWLREVNDPLVHHRIGTGALNILDYANIDSCCFIATDDLATKTSPTTFSIMGRLDNSDIRGCNLLV